MQEDIGGSHQNDRSTILIDMFDYALSHPAPATLVLMLGTLPREQFGLALSRLAGRGYHVVLVRPAESPATALDQGRKRVIQRRLKVGGFEATPERKASAL